MIIFVAAYDRKFGMGNKGGLPWPSMPADKERLHSLARGKTIVMGERTYHDYRDYRTTYQTDDVYVVSLELEQLKDAIVLNSIEQVLELEKEKELWVIGGATIFTQLIDRASRMYLTEIDGEFKADTFFPKYVEADWSEVERYSYDADSQNPYPYTFIDLKRVES